jgi:hypothetical protein
VNSLFDGRWELDPDNSEVWDDASGKFVADEVGQEIITIQDDGLIQDFEVIYGNSPIIRMGYRTQYDIARWVPSLVREIRDAEGADLDGDLAAFKDRIKASGPNRERYFKVGQPYALVRLVYINQHLHYRIDRNYLGEPQSLIMRLMATDEQSYTITQLDPKGRHFRTRKFVRV